MATKTPVHYNKQYLENEVRELARHQQVTDKKKPLQPVTPLLNESKDVLTETYRELAKAAKENRELSSAGEWFIDNFYIIQEQLVQLKEDLPVQYYKKLPRISEGEFKGFPRIYALIQRLAVLSDNIIDQDNTTTAVQAFQEVSTLKLGELWAIPILIRFSLIIRLTEKSKQLLELRKIRDKVDRDLEKILDSHTEEPGFLLRRLPEIAKREKVDEQYLTLLAQRVQAAGLLTDSERIWFDYKFSHWNTRLEDQLRVEAQRTSRLHLSIQNAISTLRDVSELDWSGFVEECSVIEQILRQDPSGYYPNMDFKTRDRYRKVVEKLSTYSSYSEPEVAQQVLTLTEASEQQYSGDPRKSHVGYFLVDEGYSELTDSLNYRMPVRERLRQWLNRHPGGYFSLIGFHAVLLLAIAVAITGLFNASGWLILLGLVAAAIPALDLAIVSTNRIFSLLIPPKILPKLKNQRNIPERYRTVVVVPTLFSSPEDVVEQFEKLEVRSLANPKKELQFIILSDFTDADQETLPEDDEILETAKQQVARLNEQYKSSYGKKFFFLHRKRMWNSTQDAWMGWERKRGKLEEFNRLMLNHDADTSFITINDEFRESFSKVPVTFVITLDADTKLPPGSAMDLIRTAAHPLNRAQINESDRRVKKGYGVIQPRISILPQAAGKSWFARIFSGNVGLDPYTTAVSDVYQDLFGEGIFTGKGIYDLEVFETVLDKHFPDNKILSHDLIEGSYLRCGLATDIELYDDYPTNYISYTKRNHRWIRGDWQILYWLFSKIPVEEDKWEDNPINGVSRWKIFDNLRRSLNPFFLLLLLLLGWTALPGPAWFWTITVLGITAFPIYSSFSTEIFGRPTRLKWKLYFEKIRSDIRVNTIQATATFMFLPHQAYISFDAIFRTLWRMFVSNKNLLEWVSSSQTERETSNTITNFWRKMWINVAWSALCIYLGSVLNPTLLILIIPFCIAWLVAPPMAYVMGSRRVKKKETPLNEEDIRQLRIYSRRTWHYFERYVNKEHSWLPPDNFQEEPYVGAMARTSPTNIGFGLASTYTAFEFGYLTVSELLQRLENTLHTMEGLKKYSGHFYNWYSTKNREVLHPQYISTVDSGNLAAGLLFISQSIENLKNEQWLRQQFWEGLQDTAWTLHEIIDDLKQRPNGFETFVDETTELVQEFESLIPKDPADSLQEWKEVLTELRNPAQELSRLEYSEVGESLSDVEEMELKHWFCTPLIHIRAQLKEVRQVSEAGLKNDSLPDWQVADLCDKLFPEWSAKIDNIVKTCNEMVQDMNFTILYNKNRDLFSIGYNVDHAALDKGTYDLMASEARLASFIAIAKGDVPPKHWFKLSRRLTSIERNEILLSWGGTMFEYLMPMLFLMVYDDTLLSNTYENAIKWQRQYGESRGNPWGFSESGYGVLNLELHYQYRAFGVPGLGLKRGLAEDYVVSPYSSMLALMIHPQEALANLRALQKEGAYSLFGFYEAVDYTPKRGEVRSDKNIVRMHMAHHQGMSLLALTNVLKKNIVQNIFHSNPLIKACELLLQERIPRGIPIKEPRPIDLELEPGEEQKVSHAVDYSPKEALKDSPPRTHLLSNGQYTTVYTHAGTGFSTYNNLALTRWRPERVKDALGFFFYVKDLDSGEYWSAGHRPVNRVADRYDTWFHAGKVQTARVDQWIETFTEVCVSPEDNIELRKITLTNYSEEVRKLEITSYAEVVLNQQSADAAHPAFSNLFVQTDHIPEHQALVAKRRPRTAEEQPVWLVHTLASEDLDSLSEPLQYETDRAKFIGRGRSLDDPAAMDKGNTLSGSTGNVPDPVVSLRRVVELKPGEKKSITFGLGTVNSWDDAVTMADEYDNPYATDRIFELASIYGRVELDHIGINGELAHYFQKIAGALLYGNEQLSANEEIMKKNRRTQSDLWSYGISGDLPILLYRIHDPNHIRYVEQLLKGHMLWRLKGIEVDLVIMYDHPPSYIEELRDAIHRSIQSSPERHLLNKRGGVFVIHRDEMPVEDRILLETVATVDMKGKLSQIDFSPPESFDRTRLQAPYELVDLSDLDDGIPDHSDLQFFNGYGGFTDSGREYVIHMPIDEENETLVYPPAPWINVIANSDFGFITSERGSDYTWSINSRENRLTPWSNDAVIDPAGEAIYIRDEDKRIFWTPTPGPSPGSTFYEVRHGFGYTKFSCRSMDIDQEVTKWVPLHDSTKIIRVRLTNKDSSPRTLSVFNYLEWLLGVFRGKSSRFVITELARDLETIFAKNSYNNEFANRIAFASMFTENQLLTERFTSDRTYFIGKNEGVTSPRALRNEVILEERFGAGFDPCAATQVQFSLQPGESKDVYFLLGEEKSKDAAIQLIKKYRDTDNLESSLEEVKSFWEEKLGRIQISTPVPELDILFNGWLQYQNISCRMWGRSGFYQSGGAYGFRDQLQDAGSALYLDPKLARKQILEHAEHQFLEGDVLHWWHPPTGRGIRSRITDDLLWLPYITSFYVQTTGDKDILGKRVPFITARTLEEGEHEVYLVPEDSGEQGSLYEHCCRTIDRSLTQGPHGLPLIGTGDWNDGMNRVGEKGKGESVWLGFFLYTILDQFIPFCKKFNDAERVDQYQTYKKRLKKHLNREGWDGEWYRRAYYDDGTPLGSSENMECQIDAIAQAWSVISGAAHSKKAHKALQAAKEKLVDDDIGIIRLLTPAFDRTDKNPGYIKGYIPGVRENGGQYTHGALWLVKAFAEMGYGDTAVDLIRMINPINHSLTKEKADLYDVEPYAIAADIYGESPLSGKGGWTWYTGSAGWTYRVILESILGVQITGGDTLKMNPTISSAWEGFKLTFKYKKNTEYRIKVSNRDKLSSGKVVGTMDGEELAVSKSTVKIKMEEDGKKHEINLEIKKEE